MLSLPVPPPHFFKLDSCFANGALILRQPSARGVIGVEVRRGDPLQCGIEITGNALHQVSCQTHQVDLVCELGRHDDLPHGSSPADCHWSSRVRCGKTPPISGWTPEGQAQLCARLEAKGLPVIDYREVVDWTAQMRRLNSPMIFNRANWGLAELDLAETILPSLLG
jgi:hypothetical protein